MPSHSCIVEDGIGAELRLDRYIAENLKILSRSQIKARGLEAQVNGKTVKLSRILKAFDKLELQWKDAEAIDLIPENIPLDVIYEDPRVIVVNKAQGMVVHPGAGNWHGTLANALLYRKAFKDAKNLRPGIVHRLDKDTSGLIIAAWDDEALAFLASQFKNRSTKKTYAALVKGCPKEKSGTIETFLIRNPRDRKTFTVSKDKGKASITQYRVVKSWGSHSLLLLRPKTGRTHQLRVHLKYLGYPILGDPLYGVEDRLFPRATLMLHAKRLSIVLPGSGKGQTFRAPLPLRFHEIFKALD
ncbi:RluA family pseudouridine synthase [Leadbettera azotonutricia]|uniref:Pseudouridine synthase n=1 Tax=Leadbettera azotonutricia (strain ATCC BAA-888 / DSM 13862 / ZAS-9) TaxID=545695 RepID=F5YAC5_LEAAZ|nr:RluA family pseudouridine synthase [Leadbettera azotonutricia]AEF83249.1 ribosomal large subunit pseudouridine synthase D [Leadbettera azotonutricia ZAS-9]